MKFASILPVCLLLTACDQKFNWYDNLAVKPAVTEVAGIYHLGKGDTAAAPLIEMGYTQIEATVDLRADGTYTADGIPGCGLHGDDERMFPFTGGTYSFSGPWSIIKTGEIYAARLEITQLTEQVLPKTTDDPDLAMRRKLPSAVEINFIRGNPIDIGFLIYDGDFWPLRLRKAGVVTAEEPSGE